MSVDQVYAGLSGMMGQEHRGSHEMTLCQRISGIQTRESFDTQLSQQIVNYMFSVFNGPTIL